MSKPVYKYRPRGGVCTASPLITVYLQREYGFDEWVWHTGMTAGQLRSFWLNIEDAWTYCKDIHALPGSLEPWGGRYPDGKKFHEVWSAGIHTNRDSVLCPPHPRGAPPEMLLAGTERTKDE